MSRRPIDRDGAFNAAMRQARVAYWRKLQKAHPTDSLRQLAARAGVSASSAMRCMREAGFVPVADTRWVVIGKSGSGASRGR